MNIISKSTSEHNTMVDVNANLFSSNYEVRIKILGIGIFNHRYNRIVKTPETTNGTIKGFNK